jgi:hypothetical protein
MHRLLIGMIFVLSRMFTPCVWAEEPMWNAQRALRISQVELEKSWTQCGQTWVTTIVLTRLQRFGLAREPQLFAVYQVAKPIRHHIRRSPGASRTDEIYEVRWYAQKYRRWYSLLGAWTPWNENRGNEISFFRSQVEFSKTELKVSSDQLLHAPGEFKKPSCTEVPRGIAMSLNFSPFVGDQSDQNA